MVKFANLPGATLLAGRTSSGLAIYSIYCGKTHNKTFKSQPVNSTCQHFFLLNNHDVLVEAAGAGSTPVSLDLEVSGDPVLSAQQAKIAKVVPHRVLQFAKFEFALYTDDKNNLNVEKVIDYLSTFKTANALYPLLADSMATG